MKKEQRLLEIQSILQKNKSVSTVDLVKRFNTSFVTIRKDLDTLEEMNVLIRTHGGAVPKDPVFPDEDIVVPENVALPEERLEKMRAIAKVASNYIINNTWIYLSSGHTCTEVAKQMLDKKLTVVTGGLYTGIVLTKAASLSVIMVGGMAIASDSGAFLAGDLFQRSMQDIRVDQAFISISGIDFNTGYSVGNAMEILNIQKLKAISKETIIIADSTKFGLQGFLSAEPLDSIDTVITNRDIPDDYMQYYEEHGVKVITD